MNRLVNTTLVVTVKLQVKFVSLFYVLFFFFHRALFPDNTKKEKSDKLSGE